MINGSSVGNEAAAATLAHHVVATAAPAMLRHVSNSQCRVLVLQTEVRGLELLLSQVRKGVVAEFGCVGLARSGRLGIEFSDLLIIIGVDLSAESKLSHSGIVLIVRRHEALEARVVCQLVELLGVGGGGGGADDCSNSES